MRKLYEIPQLEVLVWEMNDVITTSLQIEDEGSGGEHKFGS